MPRRCRGRCWGGSSAECPGEGRSPARRSLSTPLADERLPALLDPGLRRGTASRNPPLPLGPPRLPAARHRPGAASQGTGRNGRITREDVDRAVAPATMVSVGEPATAQPRHFAGADIPHDRMRLQDRREHGRARSPRRRTSPPCSKPISRAIAAHKAALAARGTKLSYTAYIVKAAAEAMAVAPAINGRWEDDRIADLADDRHRRRHRARREGAGRPGGQGRRQRSSLEQIGARLDDLTAPRARGQARPARDVSGGSFTISNHGVSGSLLAAPIILHQGQAAILGIGKLEKRVVVREIGGQDAILVRPMAYVTLTIDHRVVDGHQTNAWLTPLRRNHRKLADSRRNSRRSHAAVDRPTRWRSAHGLTIEKRPAAAQRHSKSADRRGSRRWRAAPRRSPSRGASAPTRRTTAPTDQRRARAHASATAERRGRTGRPHGDHQQAARRSSMTAGATSPASPTSWTMSRASRRVDDKRLALDDQGARRARPSSWSPGSPRTRRARRSPGKASRNRRSRPAAESSSATRAPGRGTFVRLTMTYDPPGGVDRPAASPSSSSASRTSRRAATCAASSS